jgi:MFS transporter, DHA1 family, inner membrane transport protein
MGVIMSQAEPIVQKQPNLRFLVSSLAFSSVAIAVSNGIITLLLIEIASAFQVSEGIAAQIRTVNAAAELIFALLMCILVVRFKHKSLLITGLSIVVISGIGTYLTPTFELMLFFSFLEGMGTVMVTIMAFTIIGDFLSNNKKAQAVGYIVAAGYFFALVGSPLTNFVANLGGWRLTFMLLVVPMALIGLVLVFFCIKTPTPAQNPRTNKSIYISQFKEVLKNKSATFCLLSSLFYTGPSIGLFVVAFMRENFGLSRDYSVYILIITALFFITGSLLAGRLGNRLGVKTLTLIGFLTDGFFIILIFCSPNIWLAMSFNFIHVLFTGIGDSAFSCLAVDQIPNSRGTMISLIRVFTSAGKTLTPAIGGALLVILASQPTPMNYQALGITLGAITIFAAILLKLFVKNQTSTNR